MRVIAKAYGNRPLDRVAVDTVKTLTYVVAPDAISGTGMDPHAGVGFPNEYVFVFERELYESLADAWLRGDEDRLAGLWETAQPLRPNIAA